MGRALPWLALGALVSAPLGWVVTDRLEQDNTFCVACHLEPGRPLHQAKLDDLAAMPPLTLAAAHGGSPLEGREDPAFRCIDCHGGTGPVGRARVKLLSAKDAFWYVTGRFDEPEEMHWPLWDADCRKCHDSFEPGDATGGDPRFHELAVHNEALGVACVACHRVHDPGGLPGHHFLHPAQVRARCAECHPEYEESS